MAKLKIAVNDLHKYYGEKESQPNSMKGMSFVSSDLQVRENQPFFAVSTCWKKLQVDLLPWTVST